MNNTNSNTISSDDSTQDDQTATNQPQSTLQGTTASGQGCSIAQLLAAPTSCPQTITFLPSVVCIAFKPQLQFPKSFGILGLLRICIALSIKQR